MINFKTYFTLIISTLFLTFLVGCQSIDVRGQYVSDNAIRQINLNKPNQNELVDMIGTPNYVPDYTENIWYYIQRSLSSKAWFDPKVVGQRVVKITFDNNKKVTNAILLDGEQDETINVNSAYTETHGTEQNGLQKFVKNLGRFNQTSKGGSSRRKSK